MVLSQCDRTSPCGFFLLCFAVFDVFQMLFVIYEIFQNNVIGIGFSFYHALALLPKGRLILKASKSYYGSVL